MPSPQVVSNCLGTLVKNLSLPSLTEAVAVAAEEVDALAATGAEAGGGLPLAAAAGRRRCDRAWPSGGRRTHWVKAMDGKI